LKKLVTDLKNFPLPIDRPTSVVNVIQEKVDNFFQLKKKIPKPTPMSLRRK